MVFSTSPTRDSLSFEDFLDLLSVFSDTATPDIKSHYAFRIFGKHFEKCGAPSYIENGGQACARGTALEQVPIAPCCLDFDDDGTLDREDLSQLVNCLTGEGEDTRLSASEMKQLIDNVS